MLRQDLQKGLLIANISGSTILKSITTPWQREISYELVLSVNTTQSTLKRTRRASPKGMNKRRRWVCFKKESWENNACINLNGGLPSDEVAFSGHGSHFVSVPLPSSRLNSADKREAFILENKICHELWEMQQFSSWFSYVNIIYNIYIHNI